MTPNTPYPIPSYLTKVALNRFIVWDETVALESQKGCTVSGGNNAQVFDNTQGILIKIPTNPDHVIFCMLKQKFSPDQNLIMNQNAQSPIFKFQALLKGQSISPEDVDYSILDYHIPFLESLDTIENSSVVLFDFLERKYRFITARFKYLIGYDRDTALSEGPEYFLKQIHPDDLPGVIETTARTMQFILNLPIDERKDYKLCYSFRIRHATGKYIRLMHQAVTIELDHKGNPWLSLITNDLVPAKELNGPFRRFLINLKNSRYYLFTPEEDHAGKESGLSGREIEILGLMAKGLPSKQIANQLLISINTVNNHRANILRKLQAGNAIEAVQYAARMGLV